MNVYQAYTSPHQIVLFDKKQNFVMINGRGGRKRPEKSQYLTPILQVSTGQFSNDKGMANDIARFQQGTKVSITRHQMVNPH